MSKAGRNPRRSYDAQGNEIRPMTLGNMRDLGVTKIAAYCEAGGCGHAAIVDVAEWPADHPVPDVALRLRCAACGGKSITTMPAWHLRQAPATRPDSAG